MRELDKVTLKEYKKWLKNKIPQDYLEQVYIDIELETLLYGYPSHHKIINKDLLNKFNLYKIKKEVIKKLDNF